MAVKAQTNNLADWITKANLQFINNKAAPGFVSHHKLLHCQCFAAEGGLVEKRARARTFGYNEYSFMLWVQFINVHNYISFEFFIKLLPLINFIVFIELDFNLFLKPGSLFSSVPLFTSSILFFLQSHYASLTDMYTHTHHWKPLEIQKYCLERLWESIIPLWSGP